MPASAGFPRPVRVGLITAALTLATLHAAWGAPARFWLSPSVIDPMGPAVATESAVASSQRFLHVWAQPRTMTSGDYDKDTNPFDTFRNISLNVATFNTDITYDAAGLVVHNPEVTGPMRRFQFTSGATTLYIDPPVTPATASVTVEGFTIQTGATAGFGGAGCGGDPLCRLNDAGEPAWLFASIPFQAVNAGNTANSFLQIGGNGMNHFPPDGSSSDTNVTFGDTGGAEPTYNAGNSAHRNETLGGDLTDVMIPTLAAPQNTLTWAAGASGNWATATDWSAPMTVPTSIDDAILPLSLNDDDVVRVLGSQAANATTVRDGRLAIVSSGALASNVTVESGGAVSGPGWIAGDLDLDGTLGISTGQPLRVLGEADVSGAQVTLADGLYLPKDQTVEITILEAYGGLNNTFSTTNGATIATGVTLHTIDHVLADADPNDDVFVDSVIVTLETTLDPTSFGDYDGNGTVDSEDYTLWRNTEGDAVTPGTGADGDGDGTIDDDDYDIWVKNYGAVALPPASFSVATPEPGSAALLLIAAALATMRPNRS